MSKAAASLLDLVAGLAVLAELRATRRLVVVVVTPEAAGEIDVSDVRGIGAEGDVHLGKDVAPVDRARAVDGLLDVLTLRRVRFGSCDW